MHHLMVKAYDDDGNAFSSLEGFSFDWTILDGHDSIMRVSPQDAGFDRTYKHAHGEHALPGAVNDDDFFCKGILPGHTHLQVQILEKGYENVPPALIHLTIVESFVLFPAFGESEQTFETEVGTIPYILPTSPFNFKLAHTSMGTEFEEI